MLSGQSEMVADSVGVGGCVGGRVGRVCGWACGWGVCVWVGAMPIFRFGT